MTERFIEQGRSSAHAELLDGTVEDLEQRFRWFGPLDRRYGVAVALNDIETILSDVSDRFSSQEHMRAITQRYEDSIRALCPDATRDRLDDVFVAAIHNYYGKLDAINMVENAIIQGHGGLEAIKEIPEDELQSSFAETFFAAVTEEAPSGPISMAFDQGTVLVYATDPADRARLQQHTYAGVEEVDGSIGVIDFVAYNQNFSIDLVFIARDQADPHSEVIAQHELQHIKAIRLRDVLAHLRNVDMPLETSVGFPETADQVLRDEFLAYMKEGSSPATIADHLEYAWQYQVSQEERESDTGSTVRRQLDAIRDALNESTEMWMVDVVTSDQRAVMTNMLIDAPLSRVAGRLSLLSEYTALRDQVTSELRDLYKQPFPGETEDELRMIDVQRHPQVEAVRAMKAEYDALYEDTLLTEKGAVSLTVREVFETMADLGKRYKQALGELRATI